MVYKNRKIAQEMPEIWSGTKWHVFMAHGVVHFSNFCL